MLFLKVIWMTALVLITLSLCLWIALLIVHEFAMSADKRRAKYEDAWLDLLLDVLDGSNSEDTLPTPKSTEEIEAVVSLLRNLAERFSGSYGERMVLVLDRIQAAKYALHLLASRNANNKVRGCALLGWCGPSAEIDGKLEKMLDHRDARVVLEAASSLVRRGAVRDIVPLVHALCRTRAANSLLARDLFRRWGEHEMGDWSELLQGEWTDNGWCLLLEAAGASGRSEWSDYISAKANHGSPQVVKAVLSALEHLGDPAGEKVAILACEHPNARVRRQAVKTLEACSGLAGAYEILKKRLLDESYEVRRAALQGILKLGGRSLLLEVVPADYWQSELFKETGIITEQ